MTPLRIRRLARRAGFRFRAQLQSDWDIANFQVMMFLSPSIRRLRRDCIARLDAEGLRPYLTSFNIVPGWTWRPWFVTPKHAFVGVRAAPDKLLVVPLDGSSAPVDTVFEAITDALKSLGLLGA